MSTVASTANWLIQATLLKTSNPVVSPTLSVPASVTFSHLHYAIEAVFGWEGDETTTDKSDDPSPLVKVVKGNPFRAEEYSSMPALFTMRIGGEFDPNDVPEAECGDLDEINVHHILNNFRFWERYITYDYHRWSRNGYTHVIHCLGRLPDESSGRIACVAAHGYTTLKAWSKRAGPRSQGAVFKGGPSSWELDFEEVRARLDKVEDARLEAQHLRAEPREAYISWIPQPSG